MFLGGAVPSGVFRPTSHVIGSEYPDPRQEPLRAVALQSPLLVLRFTSLRGSQNFDPPTYGYHEPSGHD